MESGIRQPSLSDLNGYSVDHTYPDLSDCKGFN